MTASVAFWLTVAAAGVFIVLVGARRPTLAERVQALRPASVPTKARGPSVFKLGALESIRPGLEKVGERVGSLLRLIGLDPGEIGRRLALAGRSEGLALYLGTKALFVVAGIGMLPLLASAGLLPMSPAWAALPVALAAFFLPDVFLLEAGRVRRLRLEAGLVEANLDLAMRLAAGMGLGEAMEGCQREGEGPFFEELSRALASARASGLTPAAVIEDLGRRMGLDEARDLAAALKAGDQGVPLADSLLGQARSITERHRLNALAAGQRAEIRMLLVQAAFILPGFFVLILYPVATKLLEFAGG